MKKRSFAAAAAISTALFMIGSLGTAWSAQEKGNSDLQLSGGFFHAQGADAGTLALDIGYGYYATRNLEVGIMQTLGYSFIDDADDEWTASTIPFVNYYFRGLSSNDTFQPFVGAFIGASYNKDDTTGTIGPQLGFKSFVSDKTYIAVTYRYEWFFDELTINDVKDTRSDGNHVTTLGVGFTF